MEEERWLDSTTDSMGMNLSKLQETAEDRGAGHATGLGSQRDEHNLATEQQVVRLLVQLSLRQSSSVLRDETF